MFIYQNYPTRSTHFEALEPDFHAPKCPCKVPEIPSFHNSRSLPSHLAPFGLNSGFSSVAATNSSLPTATLCIHFLWLDSCSLLPAIS
jgi:hypothetical protein